MNNPSRIIIAFLAGAAVGAAMGLLFAPMSGEELLENLNNRAYDLTDKLKQRAEAGINYAKNIRKTAADKVNDLLSNEKNEDVDFTT